MTYKHWQEIKAKHPKVLDHCIEYFQLRFLDNWREKIKVHRHIFEYFTWIHKMEIEVNDSSFSIALDGHHLSNDGFVNIEQSEVKAILKAFELISNYKNLTLINHFGKN